MSTTLSGGGQSGASISVPANTAVTDAATLSGTNAATATGTVTYNVYSDPACTMLVNAGTAENIVTPGTLPTSAAVALNEAGTYYWQVSYSGDDTLNSPSVSTCGGEPSETVTGASTSVSTTLSGGGKTGASISVPANTAVTDAATLSGTNAATATGTVTYNVYSDPACTDQVSSGTPEMITTAGTLPASSAVTLGAGTYYWRAIYSGDTNNVTSTSTCGSETETVTSATTTPKATTLTTQLSGSGYFGGGKCSWLGRIISVFAGATVTDFSPTLGGANASGATGTVTYTVYGHVASKSFPFWQWKPVASGGTVTVTGGKVPASKSVTLPAGIYEWQASYSGDTEQRSVHEQVWNRDGGGGPRTALQLRLELGT